MSKNFEVFISYRRKETADKAEHLFSLLEMAGYKGQVSFDRENFDGRFDLEILQRLDDCKDFIVVLAPETLAELKEEDTPWYEKLARCSVSEFHGIETEMNASGASLDFLENSVVKANGYVIAIMNERVLNPNSDSRYELIKAIRDKRSIGKENPNIIPIATQKSVVKLVQEDKDLSPLVLCNIQSIDGLDKEKQCDEIVKRVVTQLMTPGSIKVLADNLSKGIYGDANVKEADFLYGLLGGIKEYSTLRSESGTFYIDENGIAQRFDPSDDNPLIEEKTTKKANYTYDTYKSIRTFIVPKGVKGFVTDFMRATRVVERFQLPEGLTCIGENCFVNCVLPKVVIPQSLQHHGLFAFGHSQIDVLQLPATLYSPYGRQFKDSHIGVLRLPKEWGNNVALGKYNDLRLDDQWFDSDNYGYLRWPSTKIENLEFY